MSIQQAFNRSVNRVFILGIIQNIQVYQSGQTLEYHLILETKEEWINKFGSKQTQEYLHYIVLDQSFTEDCKNLIIGQSLMLQGSLKNTQTNQYSQFKCGSYIQVVSLFDLEVLCDLDDIEDGLPFSKQFINDIWSNLKATNYSESLKE